MNKMYYYHERENQIKYYYHHLEDTAENYGIFRGKPREFLSKRVLLGGEKINPCICHQVILFLPRLTV